MNTASPNTQYHFAPFDNTRDVRFFFESEGHSEALSRLTYLVQDKTMGMGMLTGEIGCGKTMTLSVLANRLDPDEFQVVSLENCLLDFDDLLLEIISQMRAERIHATHLPDRYSRMAEYKRLLINICAQRGKHLVILVDEAQQLDGSTLEALKGLSNISSERFNYASLILAGQPELRDRVRSAPQIDQRISLRFHLNPISLVESKSYLIHRLKIAGLDESCTFEPEAIGLLTRQAQGIPRNLNRLSKLALDYATSRDLQCVSTEIASAVISDLEDQSGFALAASGMR